MKKNKPRPLMVAIVGGSGAGKTWLAEKLLRAFRTMAIRVSLDDFYRDRSGLSAARRAKINFDHPVAIDWASLETALNRLRNNHSTPLPCYDFKTHCRLTREKILQPKPIVIVDGLWLLRRPRLRGLFDLKIFIECPSQTRLQRRLIRDLVLRGRTAASVREQFRETVEPMHAKFVVPQKRWADVVLPADFGEREVQRLADAIKVATDHKADVPVRRSIAVARRN
ncbi:MAG: uridine kinase [Verrucomicrobiota bacterium]|jgi:uridine kinase